MLIGRHIVEMIARKNLLQEILKNDTLTLGHSHKHVLRLLRLYGDQAKDLVTLTNGSLVSSMTTSWNEVASDGSTETCNIKNLSATKTACFSRDNKTTTGKIIVGSYNLSEKRRLHSKQIRVPSKYSSFYALKGTVIEFQSTLEID